jgi:hypothetical protein
MIINKTSKKDNMNFLLIILFLIEASTCLNTPLMAQSEQGQLLGIVNFEKSFPTFSSDPEWEYFNDFFMNNHLGASSVKKGDDLKTLDIIGKEMTYEYDLYTVHLVISSDSTLHWKDVDTAAWVDEKSKTIHIDDYRMLTSWFESGNTFVTMFSDFRKGEASAFLYKDDGGIIPLSGSIKIK